MADGSILYIPVSNKIKMRLAANSGPTVLKHSDPFEGLQWPAFLGQELSSDLQFQEFGFAASSTSAGNRSGLWLMPVSENQSR